MHVFELNVLTLRLSAIGTAGSFNAGFVYALIKNNISIDNIHSLSEEI